MTGAMSVVAVIEDPKEHGKINEWAQQTVVKPALFYMLKSRATTSIVS